MIAGFDMEHNQLAADGTTFDNGYGICMIPKTQLITTTEWSGDTLVGAYMSSTMHTSYLPNIVSRFHDVLGSHIVNRNVLLSSSVDSNNKYYSNAYTWTTAYATLMSVGQMTGTFATYTNKYDDGEANYKLPIFNYEDFKTGLHFWTRCVGGRYSYYNNVYYIDDNGLIGANYPYRTYGVRPLIYLR